MGDVLIIGKDDKSCFDVEQTVKSHGFRPKLIFECETGEEWLRMRPFDALLLDVSIGLTEQQRLATVLWQKNPIAHLMLFDLRGNNVKAGDQARLFGADFLYGPKGISHLSRLLEKIRTRKPVSKGEFQILVVEDLDSPRDIICFYLEGLGFSKIKGVSSAREAIAELEEHPKEYACVITDVKMPEMTGRDLIEHLRRDNRFCSLPIIVLTAIGTVENLIDCLKAGASGFLVKPPKKEDILRELSRALRISANGENPCLVQPENAESLKEALLQRGVY